MTEFDSAIRNAGDLAGVYEDDGATRYFYLYQCASGNTKILDWILLENSQAGERDVEVRWARHDEVVGVFLDGTLSACFDVARGGKFGGNPVNARRPISQIPKALRSVFE